MPQQSDEQFMTNESEDYILELLGFCGCVNSEVVGWMISELRKCREEIYDDSNDSIKARVYMDSKEWIDHGTAIRCSWLTEKGANLLWQIEHILENDESPKWIGELQ